ncbi:UDP-N-acetylglucosamine 1-carboxyvinyltransferase [Thermosyntropha sp.]|uniref:UDP-N-acetylglucosamine 1-carboxyvinyltransferase n=1 Tax=Thermosyntropha sp. TaxID=2740820 RepID=UPI0025F4120E|nr:UDP-N-acetylglucosamine 1-carboxyvinyltransferase [Thermosyntropha sp.]MBO8157986.1 UDP-N-acetylglucosamine 1-carboxyvinyltransferase [Thermosyntropha sp.]
MKMVVQGEARLTGEVEISSSKNAVLPVLAATLLTEEKVVLRKVPFIEDVKVIKFLLKELGVEVKEDKKDLNIIGQARYNHPPYEMVKKIRASFLLMGPVLATKGLVRVSLPGGCAIGTRPIDLHLKGFKALGAQFTFSGGDIIARVNKLKGTHIYLDFPSVGATENIMMAAALASGTTYIENAALEPEIVDLANFINSMGGKISGAGTNIIRIEGVKELKGTEYSCIPDRIEAGTFMLAAAATGGDVLINNVIPEHVKAITAKLIETGVEVEERGSQIRVKGQKKINPVYIKTMPYPGFPTDMQAQFMAYLSCADGSSIITESVFENRFMHVQELMRMGASIKIEGKTAIIKGVSKLHGTEVIATDLRAGAALLIAGMMAQGSTTVTNSYHINRGYENVVEKLRALGADIKEV